MTSYCLSHWCIGAQLKIHVLHTTQVGGLSSTEKSFHVVRACAAQCVCLVSSGQGKEPEKEGETEKDREKESPPPRLQLQLALWSAIRAASP